MSKETFEPQTEHKRLHPTSPLFILLDAIIKVIFPVVIAYFLGGASYFNDEWFIVAVSVFASVGTVIQYWFYRYWLESDRIVVKSGVLFKELRQVPYERIQNVNIKSTILHKFLKVATVQIESASGSKPEAVIRVVGMADLAQIQQAIKTKQAVHDSDDGTNDTEQEQEITTENNPLFSMTQADITRYGCIHWQALVPLAALFGFAAQSDAMREKMTAFILSMVFYVRNFTALEGKLLNGLVLGLVLVVLAWLMSMAIAHLKLHGFIIKQQNDKLHAEMGLLTKITANIPIRRIQLLRIRETLMHRLFKRQTLTMETAGGVTQQTGIVMRWLAPLAPPQAIPDLIKSIEPNVDLNQLTWQSLSPKAAKRLFKRTSAILLTLIAIPTVFWRSEFAWLTLTAPLWFWYAKAWAKHAAYAHNEHLLAFRSGVIFRNTSVVKINKVQTIHLTESPFDRRNNHGRLWVDTAGSNIALHHINIPYLEKRQLLQLHQQLTEQVSNSEFVW